MSEEVRVMRVTGIEDTVVDIEISASLAYILNDILNDILPDYWSNYDIVLNIHSMVLEGSIKFSTGDIRAIFIRLFLSAGDKLRNNHEIR